MTRNDMREKIAELYEATDWQPLSFADAVMYVMEEASSEEPRATMTERPVYRHLADYRIQESFYHAKCNDCLIHLNTESAALDHTRRYGHQILIRYVKTYHMRAQ